MNILWVVVGAAVGAPARYLLDRAIRRWRRTRFPLGTFTVNLIACTGLGFVTELVDRGAPSVVGLLVGTGFCATFSTYSTFSAETLDLARRRALSLALGYPVLSGGVGTLCAFVGHLAAAGLA